jgi:hypothetical protein
MKKLILLLLLLGIVLIASAQTHTVENIRAAADGENVKITYRIGASTETQLFKVHMECSMDGGRRFEPKSVIGDVGENIIGGKSYYTIIWDAFADVDEVNKPKFFIAVELMSDMSASNTPASTPPATRSQEPPVQQPREEPVKEEEKPATSTQSSAFEPSFEEEKSKEDVFARNGFFGYCGSPYIPIGISFGSLNNWGYYVSIRTGVSNVADTDVPVNFDLIALAGATKYIIAAGFYRLHAYAGLGGHLSNTSYGDELSPYFIMDTGVINVLGRFNLSLGLSISVQHKFPTNLVFGAGFVF